MLLSRCHVDCCECGCEWLIFGWCSEGEGEFDEAFGWSGDASFEEEVGVSYRSVSEKVSYRSYCFAVVVYFEDDFVIFCARVVSHLACM